MILGKAHIAVLLTATMSLVFLAAGCSHPSAEEAGSETAVKAEVTLTQIARASVSEVLTLTGNAAAPPNQDVRISSLVAGRVASVNVAEGDRVHSGEVIARIDDRPYRDQLHQVEAAEQQAKANLENAQLAFRRNTDLFQRGIAARKDLEDARTQQSVAEAALRQAEAARSIARLQLARTEIRSPLDGQVVKRFVSVGEQVDGTAAQPVLEVADLRVMEFLGNAAAAYLAKMHPGEAVEVTTESVPGVRFPGRVIAIAPAVDPATGVGLVRIRVPNPRGLLRMGIFLTANVPVETHANALVVPPQAIYRNEEGQPRVFVVKNNTATAVPVKIGIETKEQAELIPQASGAIDAGDTVILTGGYGLGEKAEIRTKGQ